MKKILIFSLAYAPYWGGAEIALKEITTRLGGEFSFDIITPRFNSELPWFEQVGNVRVYRVGFSKKNPTDKDLVSFPLYFAKVFYPLFAFLKAISLHRKNRYDALWAMMAYAGFPVVFFGFFHPNVPYLLSLQEGDPISHMVGRWRIRIVYPLLRLVFVRARAVQAISSYLAEYARHMGFRGQVSIVPNGVDIKKFKIESLKLEAQSLRKKLRISEGDKILITTSRLVEKNAVDDSIKALAHLPPSVKLLVAGAGPDEAVLKTLVEKSGLEKRVLFLGHIAYEDLPSYYAAADIFVRPSLSEGMGSSFIEAMAAGLPVIGTAVGGITDFLKHRETGFMCEARNPESVAEQIRFILGPENQEIVGRIVKNAKALAEKNYDWDVVARSMEGIFHQIT